jgi:cell division septum initiation protein DivIVA
MTKAQEIEALKKFKDSIPQQSYLRPWLEEIFSEVAADIKNDYPISPTVTKSHEMAKDIIGRAQTSAGEILNAAEQKAAKIVADAEAEAKSLKEQAHSFVSSVGAVLSSSAQRLYNL